MMRIIVIKVEKKTNVCVFQINRRLFEIVCPTKTGLFHKHSIARIFLFCFCSSFSLILAEKKEYYWDRARM